MAGMDNGMHHGMMGNGAPSSDMPMEHTMKKKKMMMHMTFYWGDEALILFTGWPGNSLGMYYLALAFVFVLAVLVEWLSRCPFVKPDSNHAAAGIARTFIHTVRVGIGYLVMLAVMSFNGGIFVAAVLGHSVGFLFFGSRIFMGTEKSDNNAPAMSC